MAKSKQASNGNGANLGFEEKLWAAADKLRVLTPGRYVGAEETEDDDDMPFDARMDQLIAKLKGQFAESAKLEKAILKNLAGLGFIGKEST